MKSKKILVAYCIQENYGVGYIDKGNTNIIADMIAEQTGSNSFEIRTVTPYPVEYGECIEVAKQEQDKMCIQSLQNVYRIWKSTMWYFWAFRTGGEICQWRSILFLKAMIFLARRLFHFVRMKVVGFLLPREKLQKCVLMQMC